MELLKNFPRLRESPAGRKESAPWSRKKLEKLADEVRVDAMGNVIAPQERQDRRQEDYDQRPHG